MSLYRRSRTFLVIAALALVASGCSFLGSSATPVPTLGPTRVTTPEDALAAVIATDPRLTGLTLLDPDLIEPQDAKDRAWR